MNDIETLAKPVEVLNDKLVNLMRAQTSAQNKKNWLFGIVVAPLAEKEVFALFRICIVENRPHRISGDNGFFAFVRRKISFCLIIRHQDFCCEF